MLAGRGGVIGLALVATAFAVGIFWNAPHREAPLERESTDKMLRDLGMPNSVFVFHVVRNGAVLRDAPSASGRILRQELKGAEVEVVSGNGTWTEVRDGNIHGWMRANELSLTQP